MSAFDYQFFVIGGGSGGVRAARVAAGLGASVAIAENFRYGGTCVMQGHCGGSCKRHNTGPQCKPETT